MGHVLPSFFRLAPVKVHDFILDCLLSALVVHDLHYLGFVYGRVTLCRCWLKFLMKIGAPEPADWLKHLKVQEQGAGFHGPMWKLAIMRISLLLMTHVYWWEWGVNPRCYCGQLINYTINLLWPRGVGFAWALIRLWIFGKYLIHITYSEAK